jgi:drug/metabolite transporter (DMT)-like permease
MHGRARDWAAFWLLGLIWGSSFLWIKLAVEDISAVLLVALRLFFGLVGLGAYALWRRPAFQLPRDGRRWGQYLFMGLVNTALPIALISWSEETIASGLAAILNATVPLFTLVLAHFALHDEKITPVRVLGLTMGFLGVVVVTLPELLAEGLGGDVVGQLAAQLAVLLAAACYAVGSTFARRHLRGESAFAQAFLVLLTADFLTWLALLAVERPVAWPTTPTTWLAALWLGVLGSGVAYLLYFHLLGAWGATRTSLVTYVLPVFGIMLGAIFLDEVIGWNMVVGLALILAGIGAVSLRR